jgi:Domain of unknown function (DUF4331)
VSDHFSGPRALAGPQCDICDFFAFPSPGRPGNLVLAMDVVPRADASSTFSAGVLYRFRVRPAEVEGRAVVPGNDELTVDVRFDAARPDGQDGFLQSGTCTTSLGESVPVLIDTVDDGGRVSGLRAFAGLRSDPFFLDFAALQKTLVSGRLAFDDPGSLTGPGADTLGIVVEIDRDVLAEAGFGPLVAAVAETVSAGPLPIRLERVGRPEVKNLFLALQTQDPVNRKMDLRDLYNLEDPFHVGPDYRDAYRARLDANLAYMDTFDGIIGWPPAPNGEHPLTELFIADHLVVDVSRPYAEDGFLGIERAVLAGRRHRRCGGRSINDDVMDALYTFVFGGLDARRISDGVHQATRRGTTTFPYLAPSNRTAVPPRPVGATSAAAPDHEHHIFGHYQVS